MRMSTVLSLPFQLVFPDRLKLYTVPTSVRLGSIYILQMQVLLQRLNYTRKSFIA
jgi:hypothetical protein